MTKNHINSKPTPVQRNLRLDPTVNELLVAAAEKADMSVNLFVNNLIVREISTVAPNPSSLSYDIGAATSSWTLSNYNDSFKMVNDNYSEIINTLSGEKNNEPQL